MKKKNLRKTREIFVNSWPSAAPLAEKSELTRVKKIL